jgi:mRNA interferase RelE/StbE
VASSSRYRIQIKRSAADAIERLPTKTERQRIIDRIASRADDPRPPGATKLTGRDSYRVRQGRYRIVYQIEDDRLIVTVFAVGHRREVYR